MKVNYPLLEKIIAMLLFVWGGLLLFTISRFLYIILGHISWQSFSVSRFFKNFHLNILLPTVTLIAGILLFFGKRIGWILALIATFLNGILIYIPADMNDRKLQEMEVYSLIGISLVSLLCLTSFCILLLKKFRAKYSFTNGTIWIVAMISILVTLDKIILYLTS